MDGGGVGSFAIQPARSSGAQVVATASGTGVDIARQLGTDQVIDYTAEALPGADHFVCRLIQEEQFGAGASAVGPRL